MDMPRWRLYEFYPVVAAVVTVQVGERRNAMACVWHSGLSFDPPLYGVAISPKRFSYELIIQAGAFGVNFLPFERAMLIAQVGRNSGRDMDKFSTFAIRTRALPGFQSPLLEDAYAAYDCRLVGRYPFGDHDLFVGEIVQAYRNEQVFTEELVLDPERVHPALYLGADLYTTIRSETPLRLRNPHKG